MNTGRGREKVIEWWGTSYEDLLSFPDSVIQDMGYQLHKIQQGEDPDDFSPMPEIGPGTYEIRICTDNHYRAFYVAKFNDRVHVLHMFMKKSKKGKATPRQDIERGRRYYREAKADSVGREPCDEKIRRRR